MECDPTRVCELLVGLPSVKVLGVDDEHDAALLVHIESVWSRPSCPGGLRYACVGEGSPGGRARRSGVFRTPSTACVAQAPLVLSERAVRSSVLDG